MQTFAGAEDCRFSKALRSHVGEWRRLGWARWGCCRQGVGQDSLLATYNWHSARLPRAPWVLSFPRQLCTLLNWAEVSAQFSVGPKDWAFSSIELIGLPCDFTSLQEASLLPCQRSQFWLPAMEKQDSNASDAAIGLESASLSFMSHDYETTERPRHAC
eukprot:4192459-Amphidinium_carterae.1